MNGHCSETCWKQAETERLTSDPVSLGRPCSRPLRPVHTEAMSFSQSASLIMSWAPTHKKPASLSGASEVQTAFPRLTSLESGTPHAHLFGIKGFGSSCLSGILFFPCPESSHAVAEPLTQSSPTLHNSQTERVWAGAE